jgi:hypothetical protein
MERSRSDGEVEGILSGPEVTIMRLARRRMSIRMLMLALAIVAGGLGYVHQRRSAAFCRRAEDFSRKAVAQADEVNRAEVFWENLDGSLGYGPEYLGRRKPMEAIAADHLEKLVDSCRIDLDRERALFDHYKRLEEKYRRAAAFP